MPRHTYYGEVFDNGVEEGRREIAKLWLKMKHPEDELLKCGFSRRDIKELKADLEREGNR
ncbi:MAG: hypothetical protein LBC41_14530 [Clostridiales bacterium]|jgi:hypothetical protein|nr:hypothetical protein [Clostridiales bacterium]MDR2751871.1 hypothetical protein [Clostridiales bacterium]